MLNKILCQSRPLRHVLRMQNFTPIFKRSAYADGGDHPTANDMPVPSGDYYEWYARRNGRYNALLAGGAVCFVGSFIMLYNCDDIVWNYRVPDYVD